jgi:hypothetical protein
MSSETGPGEHLTGQTPWRIFQSFANPSLYKDFLYRTFLRKFILSYYHEVVKFFSIRRLQGSFEFAKLNKAT